MKRIFTVIAVMLAGLLSFPAIGFGNNNFWNTMEHSRLAPKGTRYIFPAKYQVYQLDVNALRTYTESALRSTVQKTFMVPDPDGMLREFTVEPVSVMDPQLAAKYPFIRTFAGVCVDNPVITARFDITQKGFHGMIMEPGNTWFIDPVSLEDDAQYLVYAKKDFTTSKAMNCGFEDVTDPDNTVLFANRSNGEELLTYRLAMAATGEYTQFHGGTVAGALAAIVTSVNRVDGVYQRDLAVHFVLVAKTDTLIFTNGSTDPYTNSNGSAMLGQNQTTVTARIGSANYDIGHVFSTGGGGIAYYRSVCNNSSKAQGVTGSPTPVGDPFDIDYVAHEVGHQFGGSHTFNATTFSCGGGNRSSAHAFESGSGSTIMAYAGICSPNDLQSHSDDYFHTGSFDEIIPYITTMTGASCPVATLTNNTPPVINPGGNYIIPYQTPFRLTGSATDPDGDTTLTYCWEEYDLGPGGTWNTPSGNAPIFRSFNPTTDPVRLFPKLTNILNNNTTIGEIKPSYARTLTFKLTVRDNKLNGGGVTNNDTPIQVEVISFGVPFEVTSQNGFGVSWLGGATETITWTTGGSELPPINTPNVNILLSIDGGYTWPYTLATSVPNNGSYNITVPQVSSSQGRVMVEGDGNIFFDINNRNISITPTGIEENNGPQGWSAGPNPVNDVLHAQFGDLITGQQGTIQFELFDVSGRIVLNTLVTESAMNISVAGIQSGIYFAKVTGDQENFGVMRIVIQ